MIGIMLNVDYLTNEMFDSCHIFLNTDEVNV
jgi:hypothetical protein